jgi:protein-disulfide isomerase
MSLAIPVDETDHVLGPPDAPVTLVEYGDYQCPYCRAAHYYLQEVFANMGDDLRFVFRNMPLTQVHPLAEIAAEAAEAAGGQGEPQFWKMHDGLYENQPDLSPALITALANRIGLDMERFADDMLHHRYREKVRKDFMGAVRSGAAGTPTFFINGERYDGSFDSESLTEALRFAAAASRGAQIPQGQQSRHPAP